MLVHALPSHEDQSFRLVKRCNFFKRLISGCGEQKLNEDCSTQECADECWQNEPVERPYIDQVIQELDGFNPIDPIDPENKNVSTGLNSNESESTEIKILTWL
ncbi:kinase-like domain-containing protein [Rhizophagus irregularis DAOM 181602=DAOM 197198]|nr:kinase-like domain-containing protein [Rhizophagus irregularis DAOM 181602=DAOM 197198]